MDIAVHTGTTKHAPGTILASLSFSAGDEHACLLLQIDGESRPAKTLEQEAAGILQHSLLGSEGEAWNRLDGALKELNGLFKGMMLSKSLDDVHAVVALIDRDGGLHVSHCGRGEAYLVRGGQASQITEFVKGKPVPAFIHISSGQLEEHDAVIMATQRLLRAVTPAQLTELARRHEGLLDEVKQALEMEQEESALVAITVGAPDGKSVHAPKIVEARTRSTPPSRSSRLRNRGMSLTAGLSLEGMSTMSTKYAKQAGSTILNLSGKVVPALSSLAGSMEKLRKGFDKFLSDLRHPQRKRRAQLLLIAGVVAAFLVIWLVVSLFTNSQRSRTRAELSELVTQIEQDIATADNRRIAGDAEAANTILARAEEYAKQVLNNESRLFTSEARDLLEQIRQKREAITNVTRLSPRVVVNLSSEGTAATGMVGLGDGEFVIYDRQDTYRVLLNELDAPKRIVEDEFILQGVNFPRYNSQVFFTTGNSVLESSTNQLTSMKTEDPAGWITGKDIETYLRNLYVLVPDRKQIYKYERLTNRYSAPVPYNVNGDLTGAIDMAIDGSVYVLKEGGNVVKLFRGESQPFTLRNAPEGLLENATKLYKVTDRNFYFLDPSENRVIVTAAEGTTGESAYLRQYILEGEQLGTLVDLYVDPEETRLYVLDEKRLYVIDLGPR